MSGYNNNISVHVCVLCAIVWHATLWPLVGIHDSALYAGWLQADFIGLTFPSPCRRWEPASVPFVRLPKNNPPPLLGNQCSFSPLVDEVPWYISLAAFLHSSFLVIGWNMLRTCHSWDWFLFIYWNVLRLYQGYVNSVGEPRVTDYGDCASLSGHRDHS